MSELLILAARQIDLPSFYDDLGAPGRYGGRKTGERQAPNFNRPKMVVEAMAVISRRLIRQKICASVPSVICTVKAVPMLS